MTEIFGAGLDIGTMNICAMRDDGKGDFVNAQLRDCFRSLPYVEEFEDQLKQQKSHYIRDGNTLYVIGDEAYMQAGMAEFGTGADCLQRPMRDGILNPDAPKVSLMILRELMRACIENKVGIAREGEILYFSVPANPVDSQINNVFHAKMCGQFLSGLGYDARPLGESLAVIFSEGPKMHTPDGDIPFTGLSASFGAGMVNVCLAERGMPLDEFSIAKSGDWIDANTSKMVGEPKTSVLRTKEKKLNFNKLDESDPIILALDCYYDEMLRYVFGLFAQRFSNHKGSIEHPIDFVVSGGTACVPGFDKKIKSVLAKMDLPFEIAEVKLAGGGDKTKMLQAVARGLYLRAKQAAKKMANAKDIIEKAS
jgi:hypothetical protein